LSFCHLYLYTFSDKGFSWLAGESLFGLLKYNLSVCLGMPLELGFLVADILLYSIIEAHDPDKLLGAHEVVVCRVGIEDFSDLG